MMATSPILISSWKVGKYTAEMSVQAMTKGEMSNTVVVWSPDKPRKMTRKMWKQYFDGRNAAYQVLVDQLGETMLVVNVGKDKASTSFITIRPRNPA